MYGLFLTLHSLVRWIVLALAVWAVARAFRGWLGREEWLPEEDRWGRWFVIAMDVQALIGFLLFFLFSPITSAGLSDFGQAMADRSFRFWVTEHVGPMILALALAHIGRARVRKAVDPLQKYQRAALFYGVTTLILLMAIPWPFSAQGRPLFRLG